MSDSQDIITCVHWFATSGSSQPMIPSMNTEPLLKLGFTTNDVIAIHQEFVNMQQELPIDELHKLGIRAGVYSLKITKFHTAEHYSILRLPSGKIITAQRDDEGNGPGLLCTWGSISPPVSD